MEEEEVVFQQDGAQHQFSSFFLATLNEMLLDGEGWPFSMASYIYDFNTS
jgi:hypothetical protein